MSTQNKFKKFRNQLDDSQENNSQANQHAGVTPSQFYQYNQAQIPTTDQAQQRKFQSLQTQQSNYQTIQDPRFLGRTLVCCYKNHNPLFTIGPHWPFTACLIAFISVFFFLIVFVASDNINHWVTILSVFLYSGYLLVFGMTALLNPGIPDRNRRLENNSDFKRCQLCDMIINKRKSPYHCDDCQICVENYDHHCPWTGKCIGGGNLKCFSLFLVSTAVFIMYCIIIGVTQVKSDV